MCALLTVMWCVCETPFMVKLWSMCPSAVDGVARLGMDSDLILPDLSSEVQCAQANAQEITDFVRRE